VTKLKHFFENVTNSKDKEGDDARLFNQNSELALSEFQNIFNQVHNIGPITRAQAKLIKYKDETQLASTLLKSETENIDSLCDPSDSCAQCESEDSYFENKHSLEFQWRQLKLAEARCKQWQLKLMKTEANKINSTEDRCPSTVPECFCRQLMTVAYKCLSRDEATFE